MGMVDRAILTCEGFVMESQHLWSRRVAAVVAATALVGSLLMVTATASGAMPQPPGACKRAGEVVQAALHTVSTGPSASRGGFVHQAYKAAGRLIPKTSPAQFDRARPVALDHLRSGDVVFWGDPVVASAIYLGAGMVVTFHVGGPIELRFINYWPGEPVSGGRFLACNDR